MKKATVVTNTLICVVVVLAIALPVTAWAGGISKFRGDSASASFSRVDASGCVYTDVFVFASQDRIQSPPGPPQAQAGADIYISQYDWCNGLQLVGASGFTALDAGAFQVSKKLDAAALAATINVYDYMSGQSYDVNLDLNWRGAGEIEKGSYHSKFQSGDCKVNSRWSGSFRPATATGTVSDGTTDFTPDPSAYAAIQSAKSGAIEIGCN